MFGRATIRLGIGPHSSCLTVVVFCVVKIVRNDGCRLNSASKAFGGLTTPDDLEELERTPLSELVTH